MDNHNQVIILCGVCGSKGVYNEHHRVHNPRKITVAKNSAGYYQANRVKKIEVCKFYQENTKYVRKSHFQQIEEPKKWRH